MKYYLFASLQENVPDRVRMTDYPWDDVIAPQHNSEALP